MKKLRLILMGAGILSLSIFSLVNPVFSQEETPCVNCSGELEPECQRVQQGNKTHIFYGVATPCSDE